MKLTGIFLKDKKNNTIIAYIKQFPGVVVQGYSIDDAKKRLQDAFHKFMDYTNKIKDTMS